MEHIAIMDKTTIDKILTGKKTIESRFSKNKITPFHKINVGDVVYLKKSGGDISAFFTVKDVLFFEDLDKNKVLQIKEKYNELINASEEFWNIKESSKYATLMYIDNATRINPVAVVKRNRSAFVTLKEKITD